MKILVLVVISTTFDMTPCCLYDTLLLIWPLTMPAISAPLGMFRLVSYSNDCLLIVLLCLYCQCTDNSSP